MEQRLLFIISLSFWNGPLVCTALTSLLSSFTMTNTSPENSNSPSMTVIPNVSSKSTETSTTLSSSHGMTGSNVNISPTTGNNPLPSSPMSTLTISNYTSGLTRTSTPASIPDDAFKSPETSTTLFTSHRMTISSVDMTPTIENNLLIPSPTSTSATSNYNAELTGTLGAFTPNVSFKPLETSITSSTRRIVTSSSVNMTTTTDNNPLIPSPTLATSNYISSLTGTSTSASTIFETTKTFVSLTLSFRTTGYFAKPTEISTSASTTLVTTTFLRNLTSTTAFLLSPSSEIPPTKEEREPLIIAFAIILLEETFTGDLENEESLAYSRMQSNVLTLIKTAYQNNSEFVSVSVLGFYQDEETENVRCDGRVYFNSSVSSITELRRILSTYAEKNDLSVVKFQKTSKPSKNDDDDSVILGLNWWQIGVIIAGLITLFLLIAMLVLYTKLRRLKKRNKKSLMYDNQSCDFENHEEMKTLRASPLGNGSREKRTEADVSQDVHPDQAVEYKVKSAPGILQTKGDGLVMDTRTRLAANNGGFDEKKDGYAVPLSAATGSGDILKL